MLLFGGIAASFVLLDFDGGIFRWLPKVCYIAQTAPSVVDGKETESARHPPHIPPNPHDVSPNSHIFIRIDFQRARFGIDAARLDLAAA